MAKRFTDLAVRNFKHGKVRREIADPGCASLYLLVQPSGKKSFAIRYRFFGRPRKLTLQSGVSLAAARKLAGDALLQVAQGIDPVEEKRAANAKARASRADSLQAVCENYLAREGHRLRTAAIRLRTLERLVFPAIGAMPIESVRRSDIIRLLDKIEDENGPRQADIVLAFLRRIFNWFASRSDTFASPIVRGVIELRYDDAAHRRSRVLDDAELRAVWKAAETGGAFGALVRFLLLTGSRRSEAAGLTWDEIDGDTWTLPAIRNKTKVDLARPLSAAAQALVAAQPRVAGEPRVFGRLGFSLAKTKFDLACGVTGWRLHDLRRTARSLMSRARVDSDVAERCLGHVLPGIRAVYDRHGYQVEMRDAYEALATLVARVVNPPAGDVVTPMVRRPRAAP